MEKECSKFLETLQMDLEPKTTKDLGLRIENKGMAFIIMHVEQSTMENGETISIMVKECMNFQTELIMKENGEITWCMELGFILTQLVGNGKDNSVMGKCKPRSKKNCFIKNKSKSERKNQSRQLSMHSTICCKHWQRVIKRHLSKILLHSLPQAR